VSPAGSTRRIVLGLRLIDQAVMNGDEHAIKFTEACLRFNERRLSPAFGAAVRHALGAIGPR
jgi:hypothetical protein